MGTSARAPCTPWRLSLGAAGTFNSEAVLGVLSLIFWSLMISVTLKYVVIIMQADNEGEGGILALFALAQRRLITGSRWAKIAVGLALGGTAFFFCDALITPAISVLGAVEGLEVLNPGFKTWVIPVDRRCPHGAVRLPAPRHRLGREAVRAGDGAVVHRLTVIAAVPIFRHPQVLEALNPL